MRRLAAGACLIALWRAAPAAQAVPADRAARTTASLAIVGGRLIDGFGAQPLERSVVLVEGDHISAIGRVGQLAVPAGARIVNASGMTVMPGLWESHGHLVEAGLTPMEAIQAATLRPAQAQGVDARLGTVSVGKLADLIVVDGDPLQDITVLQHRIAHVVKNGVVYR